jgi:prepilin-type N-terminal cleavage/methylation domain-containing protein/prepilin-type processing-associated H-X9-DG protein
MKSLWQPRKSRGFTLVELLVVIAIIGILGALLLPALTRGKQRAQRIQCIGNQKELGLAFQLFAHDHQGRFPTQVPKDEGGAQDYVVAGETLGGTAFSFSWRLFQPLANELVVPKMLVCPADLGREPAATFSVLKNSNISYTIGVGASYNDPSSVLATDRNITNKLVQALSSVRANGDIIWTRELHFFKGNVLFADAHVEEWNTVNVSLPINTVLFLPYVAPTYKTTPPSSVTTSPGKTPTGNTGPASASAVAQSPHADGSPPPAPASPSPMRSSMPGSGTSASYDAPGKTISQTNAKETNGGPVTDGTKPAAAPATNDDETPPLLWLFGAARALVTKSSWWLLLLLLLLLIVTAAYLYSRRKMRARKP